MNAYIHFLRKSAPILLSALAMPSCTSIDCPLDSVVVMTLSFHDAATEEETALPCTLDIEAPGAGVLYNAGTSIKSVALPVSIGATVDTLYLTLSNDLQQVTDTLYVTHTNESHFEAMDCPGAVFHHVTALKLLPHSQSEGFPVVLDSTSIIHSLVDYNDVENIRIHYHLTDDSAATTAECF